MLLLAGTLSAQAAESLPLTQDFTKGLGKFTTTGTVKWTSDKNHGAVCKTGSKTAAEGWLISPAIDLVNANVPELTFSHAGKFFGTIAKEATLWVRTIAGTDTASWTQLTIGKYPTNKDWNYVDAKVDLSACKGKVVQLGFKYISTKSAYGTWEIKTLTVSDGKPVVTYTDKTIAELNADTKTSLKNINLKFNNAQVVWVDAKQGAYVREGDYAVQLFKTGLKLTAGQIVNGAAKFDYSPYYGMPETRDISGVTDASGLTLTDPTTAATATTTTLAELNSLKHKCDLVEIKGVQLDSINKNYYMVSGTDTVQLFDKFGTKVIPSFKDGTIAGKKYVVRGIFGTIFNNKAEVFPIEITEQVETGVTEVNTAKAVDGNVYSIDGRLVKTHAQDLSGLDQGIYIFNGKKYIVR